MEKLILLLSFVFLTFILLTLLIKESLIKGHLVKFRLAISVILLFASIVLSIFYKEIDIKYIYYATPLCIFLIGILMYFTISFSQNEKKIKDEYFHCVEKNNYFMYLNKKNKIVSASSSFLSFLNINFNEVYKRDFGCVLTKRFSNLEINGLEYNEDNINKLFSHIINSEKELNLNIKCLDIKGNEITLDLIDKPILSNSNKFIAHIIYGASKDKETLNQTEQDLNEKTIQLEMNKRRFRALLEEETTPLFFLNLNSNTIWANDSFVRNLGFSGNSFEASEYSDRIYNEDLAYYKETINSLSMTNPTYDIKYRLKKGYDYIYVHERGKKIYGPETEIVCVIEEINTTIKSNTGEARLDTILSEEELIHSVNQIPSSSVFELVCIRLLNIPQINKEHTRRVGNMAMNDYLNAISDAFVDDNLLFRTDGLEFFFIVRDTRKMDKLKSGLEAGKILRVEAKYGTDKIKIEALMGIVNNQKFKDMNMLIHNARQACEIASRDPKVKYYFYD